MLAISQALISHPQLLLLDEPFSGLAPSVVMAVMEAIRRIKTDEGRTVLMVEQSVDLAISIADHVLVLDVGRVVHSGGPGDPDIRKVVEDTYFGRKTRAAATASATGVVPVVPEAGLPDGTQLT
jgi:branched-chain amino acid transport system ATP-binding protein